jgi:hypothetical protein
MQFRPSAIPRQSAAAGDTTRTIRTNVRKNRRRSAQRGQSKKFHLSVEKSSCSRRGIGAMASTIQTCGIKGALMGIGEYLAATALVAVILWAVLGLLMQEG